MVKGNSHGQGLQQHWVRCTRDTFQLFHQACSPDLACCCAGHGDQFTLRHRQHVGHLFGHDLTELQTMSVRIQEEKRRKDKARPFSIGYAGETRGKRGGGVQGGSDSQILPPHIQRHCITVVVSLFYIGLPYGSKGLCSIEGKQQRGSEVLQHVLHNATHMHIKLWQNKT